MKYLMLVITEPVVDGVDPVKEIERWVEDHDASGARFFGPTFFPRACAFCAACRFSMSCSGASATTSPSVS